ncbi:MAG: hypothetical protein ACK5IB_12865 [Qingshengfaniella sp.]
MQTMPHGSILRALGIALVLASPALADTPLTAAQFEAYVTGKTLTYGQDGQAYGIEEYLPNRQVRWSYLGDACLDGHWYPQGTAICFAYDGADPPQCWKFFLGTQGLSARFLGDPNPVPLYEIAQSPKPMVCPGPRIGV